MSRKGWEKVCRLCGTTENLEYCSMCKYYFCPDCKKNKSARVHAMMEEKITNPLRKWGNSLGL